ncbi:MAG: hypothetical protein Ct9H300mP28_34460 [Pseudomonadota bacterium]|nr:MAG: hypothetical protein Ct9H300mP28_34460 [Pseudomonadota bacterium]
MIDCDPDIIKHFEDRKDFNVDPVYADPADPKVWQDINSVMQKLLFPVWAVTWRQTFNLRLHQKNFPDLPFLAVTTSHEDSLTLYESGAR